MALALPAVAVPMVGAFGTTAFTVYVRFDGFVRDPLLVGVRVMVPATVGVMVNVWAVDEEEKVSTVAERLPAPEPVGVRVMVPVYGPFGVTVKFVEAAPALPLDGPVNVKVVAFVEPIAPM